MRFLIAPTLTPYVRNALVGTSLSLIAVGCSGPLATAEKDGQDKEEPQATASAGGEEGAGAPGAPGANGQSQGTLGTAVDLSNVVGLAMVAAPSGASLTQAVPTSEATVSGEASGPEKTDAAVPTPPAQESNVYGYDAAGNSKPLVFGSGSLWFEALHATPKAVFLLTSGSITSAGGEMCQVVVMMRADGKLFCVSTFRMVKTPQWSGNGDLVTVEGFDEATGFGGTSRLYRFNFGQGLAAATTIYDKEGYPELWSVNDAGDVAIRYAPNDGEGRQLRVVKADGSFDPLGPAEYMRCLLAGKGNKAASFYYMDAPGTVEWREIVDGGSGVRVSNLVYAVQQTDNLGFIGDGCESTLVEQDMHYYAMEQRDRGPSIHDADAYAGKAHIVALSLTNPVSVRKYDVPGMRKVSRIFRLNPNQLLLVGSAVGGSGMVATLNVQNESVKVLLSGGAFVISDAAFVNGMLRFQGERQADSAKVVASIAEFTKPQKPTVLKVGVPKAVQLVPLN